ncbi:hypothetical protein LWM68_42180 [Niabella sp. W65]|nr:hypothetical protein [Niabella sp. W65]MCH7368760.1 hypothetical protein [Niabella sp. W65]ULT44335.1 hypothetical protein KRR40_13875 [Niabella sp. I65]
MPLKAALSGNELLFIRGLFAIPRKYEDYQQTNFNIYTEILAQQTLDKKDIILIWRRAFSLFSTATPNLTWGTVFS